MSFLELKNLSYSITNNDILNDINLNIDKSCFFSILGPSGAGKTTILRIITGALFADKGQVILDGEVINYLPMEKRQIAMVHQSKYLFPHLSVIENIQFGMKMKKFDKDKIIKKTEEIVEFFNMKEHILKYPYQLSGGQQQLVALMRALASEPKVLLLDEPFTGLDNNLKIYIRDYILKLHRQFKITTVMITHDKEDAFFMSDKIAFLFKGKMLLCEEPGKLINSTGIEEVDSFLGQITSLGDGSIVFSDKILKIN